MATMTGVKGSVTVGDGPTMNITEWEADLQRDIFDDSHFDDSYCNAKTKVGGMAQLVGRCSGWAVATATPGIGSMATENEVTGGTFALETDQSASAGYAFEGLIENLTVDTIKTGLVAVSFTFKSQGAVANVT